MDFITLSQINLAGQDNPHPMHLTPHQNQALAKLQAFTASPGARAFVLRGYAGTGKTTLVGHYTRWLEEQGYQPQLLATTGRAAKVLAAKTARAARTIHSCVYQFDEMNGLDGAADAGTQLSLSFGIRPSPLYAKAPVFIVDEASMIANTAVTGSDVARFGSGHLLLDFLEFTAGHRIVFVGDPCQLPPVSSESFSPALSPRYLRDHYHVAVDYAELTEIIRQESASEILTLAGHFRSAIARDTYEQWPKLAVPQEQQAHLHPDEGALVKAYLHYLRQQAYHEAIMVTHSNTHCRRLNHRIRMTLKGDKNLEVGELLMVVQNSYCIPLMNGDQVLVKKVKPARPLAGFNFLDVQLEDVASGSTYQTLLIRELLYNDNPGLLPAESRRLLIDFDVRMRAAGVSRKSEKYQENLRADPYLNALRAKFGYVITCHKAQGGEWPHVFLNIQKSVFAQQSNSLYRWFYTALTRASHHLHYNDDWWVLHFARRRPQDAARHFKQVQQRNKGKPR